MLTGDEILLDAGYFRNVIRNVGEPTLKTGTGIQAIFVAGDALEGRGIRMRILLVEDNPAEVELVRQAFAEAGTQHDLTVGKDGNEALSFLSQYGMDLEVDQPDLVLLDLNLPGMHGEEVLKVLKGDPRFRTLPVMVLTSSCSPREMDNCFQLQADAYVVKPLTFDSFLDLVEQIDQYWGDFGTMPMAEKRGSCGDYHPCVGAGRECALTS